MKKWPLYSSSVKLCIQSRWKQGVVPALYRYSTYRIKNYVQFGHTIVCCLYTCTFFTMATLTMHATVAVGSAEILCKWPGFGSLLQRLIKRIIGKYNLAAGDGVDLPPIKALLLQNGHINVRTECFTQMVAILSTAFPRTPSIFCLIYAPQQKQALHLA